MNTSIDIQTQNDSNNSKIPLHIRNKIGRNLHKQVGHPLCILKNIIWDYFDQRFPNKHQQFAKFESLSPIVTTKANFDDLLIPQHHPCRRNTDTYYFDDATLLRTQTSAHQTELLRAGCKRFLVVGDVYRKDSIDKTHFPIFHQVEGLCVFDNVDDSQTADVQTNLIDTLKGLLTKLFPSCPVRIQNDYFPFTSPSFEIEVQTNDKWLEVAGCGVVQPKILENCGFDVTKTKAWAFGFGLERLAMILFDIPDIRLFWSSDPRFLNQFANVSPVKGNKFKPFSELAPIHKDLSFFNNCHSVHDEWSELNEFYEICREVAGDLLEGVELFDKFYKKSDTPNQVGKVSHAYRLTYSAPDTMIDCGEFTRLVNSIHGNIYRILPTRLRVQMR